MGFATHTQLHALLSDSERFHALPLHKMSGQWKPVSCTTEWTAIHSKHERHKGGPVRERFYLGPLAWNLTSSGDPTPGVSCSPPLEGVRPSVLPSPYKPMIQAPPASADGRIQRGTGVPRIQRVDSSDSAALCTLDSWD